jgi:hypothetical protein
VCRYRYSFSLFFALAFLSLSVKSYAVIVQAPSCSSYGVNANYVCSSMASLSRGTVCSKVSGSSVTYFTAYEWDSGSGSLFSQAPIGPVPWDRAANCGGSPLWGIAVSDPVSHVCDITTAQNYVDAANFEAGPPITSGPFRKPAGGTGIRVNIGYQVQNFCLNGCQATRLTTQDVTEDEYNYAITQNEQLYVQNSDCGGPNNIPAPPDTTQIESYYLPPTADRTTPPDRPPVTPPPTYPPNAPPPPDSPPPPPPDAPPPDAPPPDLPCLGCDPTPPPAPPPTPPPPPIPPFEEGPPPPCVGMACYPPPPPTPPAPPVPNVPGGPPADPPADGCPSGTTFGSKEGVNGCYGEPDGGGRCSEGQYYGEVNGKEGCYGAQACKTGQVWGSIGDSDAKCYDLGSCYVKNNCNEECDPNTETCDSASGQYSKDCLATPACGEADAVECAILRQNWVTSCNAVQKVSGVDDCNATFKCENDPVQCAIAKMHRDNNCALRPSIVFSEMETEFGNRGMSAGTEYSESELFQDKDLTASIGQFMDGPTASGSCPASMDVGFLGASIAIPFDLICQFGLFVRGLLILSASITGLMMLFRTLTGG